MADTKQQPEQQAGSKTELLRSLVEKERLTEAEAGRLLSMIDKKLFFEQLIQLLKYKCLLSEDEIVAILESAASKQEIELPVTIFGISELSALEAICKYLREEKGLRYSEIAALLNRDQRTIWVTYSNACKKLKARLPVAESGFTIPLAALQDRKMSVLESIVYHLKKNYSLRYVEIARHIGRDERNIGAIYHKAERKLQA